MPIIIRRDSLADTANLSLEAGRATGQAERRIRQEGYDQNFISHAIQASMSRNSRPSYFERESAGAAAEGRYLRAREDAGDRLDREEARRDRALDIQEQRIDDQYELGAAKVLKEDQDGTSARGKAELEAFRRQRYQQAAAAGPEALAAFLAQETFAGGHVVPTGYLETAGLKKKKGTGPDEEDRKGISQFQRGVGTAISGGRAGDVLQYASEREAPNMTGYQKGDPIPQGPLSQKALETINELEHQSGNMDLGQLQRLRASIAGGKVDPQTKAAAMAIVDKSLQQRQGMRDVEIGQVYHEAIRRVTDSVTKTAAGAGPVPRDKQRSLVGAEAVKLAKQYGISPQELGDWVSRMNSLPTGPGPQMPAAGQPPAPQGAPPR